jgi:ABC-2 type transporter
LLRRGGQVVFHGELGKDCNKLISYFESRGAPKILLGDNPANWMLRAMDIGTVEDLADSYVQSQDHAALCAELDDVDRAGELEAKIEYTSEFAVSAGTRRGLVNSRLLTIYWRSPSYNLSRLMVSLIVAFMLGSVFVTKRNPQFFTESDMRARVSVIFLTFIITGIMAIFSVLPVMTMIRDLYYRHRDAGMYDSGSMAYALGVAEKGFIILSTAIFTLVFLGTSGIISGTGSLLSRVLRCIAFWVRVTVK